VYLLLAVVEQEQVLLLFNLPLVERQYLVLPVLLKLLLVVVEQDQIFRLSKAREDLDLLDHLHHQRAGEQLLLVAVVLLLSTVAAAVVVVVLVDTLPLAVLVEQVLADHQLIQRLVQVAVVAVVVPLAAAVVALGCLEQDQMDPPLLAVFVEVAVVPEVVLGQLQVLYQEEVEHTAAVVDQLATLFIVHQTAQVLVVVGPWHMPII
jgi:hypothetical protein